MKFNEKQMTNLLDIIYSKVLNGIETMGSEKIEDFANDYIRENSSMKNAAKDMINVQILKCGTSGFINGLGGAITLPLTLPANITSVLYIQMRMIACAAYMGGFDLKNDKVKALVYACLAGLKVADFIKAGFIECAKKGMEKLIKSISGEVIKAINKAVGFRLVTKFGQTGVINLGKLVPVMGGLVGTGFDGYTTKVIGDRAYNWFLENKIVA